MTMKTPYFCFVAAAVSFALGGVMASSAHAQYDDMSYDTMQTDDMPSDTMPMERASLQPESRYFEGSHGGAGLAYGTGYSNENGANGTEERGLQSVMGGTFYGGFDRMVLSKDGHHFYVGGASSVSIIKRRTQVYRSATDYYKLDNTYDFDVGMRLSYASHDGALMFLQGGYSASNFNYNYRQGDTITLEKAQLLHGYHVGLGMEASLGGNAFFRLDWALRDYDKLSLGDYNPRTELKPRSFTSRVGLVYRFEERPDIRRMKVNRVVFNGVYVGVKGQYSSAADLRDGNTSASSDSVGMRGGSVGGIVGIGSNRFFKGRRDIYLGTELRLDTNLVSHTVYEGSDSEIKRPVAIDWGVRIGYLYAPATMVYARGGYNWVRLEYEQGGSSATAAKTFVNGFSVGTGIESVVYDNITARLDWTYADVLDFTIGDNRTLHNIQENRISLAVIYAFDQWGL